MLAFSWCPLLNKICLCTSLHTGPLNRDCFISVSKASHIPTRKQVMMIYLSGRTTQLRRPYQASRRSMARRIKSYTEFGESRNAMLCYLRYQRSLRWDERSLLSNASQCKSCCVLYMASRTIYAGFRPFLCGDRLFTGQSTVSCSS